MAEKKITCPHCLSDKQCFEEDINEIENFKSYMCFNCGFTSNTSYTENSETFTNLYQFPIPIIFRSLWKDDS